MAEVVTTGSYRVERVLLMSTTFNRMDYIDFGSENSITNHISLDHKAREDNEDGKIIVTLTVRVNGLQDNENRFTVDVKMTGIFEKDGEPPLSEDIFKNVNAPAIIYPFIREHIANLCAKAGLGNIYLPTVNFKQ